MKYSVHALVTPMNSDNFSLESPFSTNTPATSQPVPKGRQTQASHGKDAAVEQEGVDDGGGIDEGGIEKLTDVPDNTENSEVQDKLSEDLRLAQQGLMGQALTDQGRGATQHTRSNRLRRRNHRRIFRPKRRGRPNRTTSGGSR